MRTRHRIKCLLHVNEERRVGWFFPAFSMNAANWLLPPLTPLTPQNTPPNMTYPFNLGNYKTPGRPCEWEQRGLLWQYGYNHEEAVRCYLKALEVDAGNVVALFGVAYCAGPNYNKPYCAFDGLEKDASMRIAHDYTTRAASALSASDPPLVHSLVAALQLRHPAPTLTDDEMCANLKAFSSAIAPLHDSNPENLEVATIYAESLLNLQPWALWELSSGKATTENTMKAQAVLENGLEIAKKEGIVHPGLLHLYIHCMEMSKEPEKALEASCMLEDSAPEAGHLVHMPSHIYIQVGMYNEAVRCNQKAAVVDGKFAQLRGVCNFYSLYRLHDLHFLSWAAMFKGNFSEAITAANEITTTVGGPSVLTDPWRDDVLGVEREGLADWFEGFLGTYLHVLIRFGKWDTILSEPEARWEAKTDSGGHLYTSTLTTLYYAKGIAAASLSAKAEKSEKLGEAREFQKKFKEMHAYMREKTPDRMVMNNRVVVILDVADSILEGELRFREGDVEGGLEHLKNAARLDDGGINADKELVYDEPWGWMMPARHPLGALSLEAGHLDTAETAYLQDLGMPTKQNPDNVALAYRTYPKNVWSLVGLAQVYAKQGKPVDPKLAEEIEKAKQGTDVNIFASCLCQNSC